MNNANNPNPPAAVVEHEEEYQRLDRVFSNVSRSLSRLRRHKVSIETDGAMDEPATVTIRVYGVDWARCEEELEENFERHRFGDGSTARCEMSRRIYLEVCCDACGVLGRFETLSTTPLVVTLNPDAMVEKHGWKSRPMEGSSFQVVDTCPRCFAKKGASSVE